MTDDWTEENCEWTEDNYPFGHPFTERPWHDKRSGEGRTTEPVSDEWDKWQGWSDSRKQWTDGDWDTWYNTGEQWHGGEWKEAEESPPDATESEWKADGRNV